ncbi:hypothetical protein NQ317_016330 [Molorchus minor]|uniref:MIF4G domain-containing protein n=1 Tax=Molorchus minor TaxID=1323400 RepID=A0ABQ9IZV5_9CUCU|nr:hypothetical protein NQ317_016330 [Molorchus minor]
MITVRLITIKEKEEDTSPKTSKRLKGSHKDSVGEESGEDYNDLLLNDEEAKVSDNEVEHNVKGIVKRNSDGTWEDIYGRLRNKDGAVLNKKEEKYIPPAVRAKMEANILGDTKRLEKLNRLQKQLKGLLNRLAESNMHSIATQIEDLYMNNSRNDMNDSLTNLIMGSLISKVITPERLLIEHVVLVTILHANVGTEVGAHFLQTVIKKIS